jgi:hypothetical protein
MRFISASLSPSHVKNNGTKVVQRYTHVLASGSDLGKKVG